MSSSTPPDEHASGHRPADERRRQPGDGRFEGEDDRRPDAQHQGDQRGELAPYFRSVDLRRLRAHMTDFLVAALDGPNRYAGRDLAQAHAALRVTDDAFDLTASHLLDALEERRVRPELLDCVLERIAPMRSVVVTG